MPQVPIQVVVLDHELRLQHVVKALEATQDWLNKLQKESDQLREEMDTHFHVSTQCR